MAKQKLQEQTPQTKSTAQTTDMLQPSADSQDFDESRQPIDGTVLIHFVGHSLFLLAILVVAVMMVYNYWYGEYGRHAVNELQEQLTTQQTLNKKQAQTLERLSADVQDLKTGLIAIEEHARTDLGLIKSGEIFVQLAPVSATLGDIPKASNTSDAKEALDADTLGQ